MNNIVCLLLKLQVLFLQQEITEGLTEYLHTAMLTPITDQTLTCALIQANSCLELVVGDY